jgi:hypothetical protein
MLFVVAATSLQPTIGTMAVFAGGATLVLFKYSRAEDAKVCALAPPHDHRGARHANVPRIRIACQLIGTALPLQAIFDELGWNYTFNGVKSLGVFVPKSSKGIIRKESAAEISASVNGVIATLGLAPMTIDVQPFTAPTLIIAPPIMGQVRFSRCAAL